MSDDVDTLRLFRVIWQRRLVVVGIAFVCTVAALVYALTATPIFRAQAVVTAVRDPSSSGLDSLTSQLSGLASIAGLSVGAGGGAERESKAVLHSRYLVQEFISQHQLIPVLSTPNKKPLTLWYAVKGFEENVINIREDTRQGLITLSIDWTDPAVAAAWANQFVALANDELRNHAIQESERNIKYLNAQASKTDVVEVRQLMYNLIEAETKKLMIANGRVEYAFRVVDPAVVPELRARPRRTFVVAVGLLLGALLGSATAIVLDSMRRS